MPPKTKPTKQKAAQPVATANKRVRVTVEVDVQFIKLLEANIHLNRQMRGWLLNNDDAGDLTPPQVLGLLVYMEARGGRAEQIHAATPFMWRPNIEIIHDERRVYENGKLISKPVPAAPPTQMSLSEHPSNCRCPACQAEETHDVK